MGYRVGLEQTIKGECRSEFHLSQHPEEFRARVLSGPHGDGIWLRIIDPEPNFPQRVKVSWMYVCVCVCLGEPGKGSLLQQMYNVNNRQRIVSAEKSY